MLSEYTINVLSASGIDHKPEVEALKGNKEKSSSINWMDEGEQYSHELDLLNMQLRAKSKEDIRAILERLIEEADDINPSSYDILVSKILKAHASQKNHDSYIDWSQLNSLLINIELEEKVIYGIALSMTRENNAEGAINSIKRLIGETESINSDQKHEILIRFLALYCDCIPLASEDSSPKEWENDICIHLSITKMLAYLNNNNKKPATDINDSHFAWISRELDSMKTLVRKPPLEISNTGLNSILSIQYKNNEPEAPRMNYIESKSLPRSGHHFLKSILQSTFQDNFSYCEGYQELGCCKTSPCSNEAYWKYSIKHNVPHWRLVKSHDFNMTDTTFEPIPGMFRFIQIRKPLELLISWLELQQLSANKNLLEEHNISLNRIWLYHEPELVQTSWDIIDNNGTTLSRTDTEKWLCSKGEYIGKFFGKWLPLSYPLNAIHNSSHGNYIVKYSDLAEPSRILSLLGTDNLNYQRDLPVFRKQRDNLFIRNSKKITELMINNSEILNELGENLLSNIPKLADGSSVSFEIS